MVCHKLLPTLRFGKVSQKICHFAFLQFMYRYFSNFEFRPHVALMPQFIPYMTTLECVLSRQKALSTKKMTRTKSYEFCNRTPFIYVPLVNLFLALMGPSLMLGICGAGSLGWGHSNKASF